MSLHHTSIRLLSWSAWKIISAFELSTCDPNMSPWQFPFWLQTKNSSGSGGYYVGGSSTLPRGGPLLRAYSPAASSVVGGPSATPTQPKTLTTPGIRMPAFPLLSSRFYVRVIVHVLYVDTSLALETLSTRLVKRAAQQCSKNRFSRWIPDHAVCMSNAWHLSSIANQKIPRVKFEANTWEFIAWLDCLIFIILLFRKQIIIYN